MKKFISVLLAVVFASLIAVISGCKKDSITVFVPDGAPALAIAKFIYDKENFNTGEDFEYNVVKAGDISNSILRDGADLVVIPVNVATKLYNGQKEKYVLMSVLTHGNFFIMSKTDLLSPCDLIGKVIYVPQMGKVPDLTLISSLKKENIEYEVGEKEVDNKVVICYKFTEPSDLAKAMIGGAVQIGLLPEPVATNLHNKGFNYQLSLQELYDGESKEYPQAVLLVKESLLKKHPDLAKEMSDKFNNNIEWVKENPERAVSAIKGIYENSSLSENISPLAIERCNIFWQSGEVSKTSIQKYIERIRDVNVDFINNVNEDFFEI